MPAKERKHRGIRTNSDDPIAVASHVLTSAWAPCSHVDACVVLEPEPVAWRPQTIVSRRTGYNQSHKVVLAMRYVIVIAAVTFFLIWDGLYNHGRYLDMTVREMSRIVRIVAGG